MIEDTIIENARECLGVRFQHQGKTLRGMDCRGILIYAFGKAGLQTNDLQSYSRNPVPDQMNSALLSVCDKVSINDLNKADVLYLRFNNIPTHLVLYQGNNWIIHSYLQMRKVVEHEIDQSWWNAVSAVYRHKELMK